MSLSTRGLAASRSALRIDFEIYFKAMENLYHPDKNPTGAIPLNVAENKLIWPTLKEKIQSLTREHEMPDWIANYTRSTGALSFRKSLAGFLSRFLTKCPIDPEHLALSAGSTSVIELTSWILGNPGDVVVFHAPSYPVYRQDVGNKAALERFDLVTHHELSEIIDKPIITVQHLYDALKKIESAGKRFGILVLTSPDNPTGRVFSKKELNDIADWCITHNIHLITNEIYGLSLINTDHPDLQSDYKSKTDFQSFAQVINDRKSEYLHLWYALSKDFGVSGLRVGMVYSLNKTFLEAYNNLNAPSMISNHTQWMFESLLSDHAFIEKFIQTNQQLLTESYAVVIRMLRRLEIPYIPARGSLFVWMDLSEFMAGHSQEDENKFWLRFYEQTGILLTPGEGFGHSKRGQFRLVYSCLPKAHLETAMLRLEEFVKKERSVR